MLLGRTILFATDRYVHMNPGLRRNRCTKLFEKPRIHVIICAMSLFSAALSLAFYFTAQKDKGILVYFFIFYPILMVATIALYLEVYTHGYLRIRRFLAGNPIHVNRGEFDENENSEYLKELFKTVLLLLISMLVSWVPALVLDILLSILPFVKAAYLKSNSFCVFTKATILFVYTNSFINAVIIFYRNKKSRKWLLKFFYSVRRQRNEEGPSNTIVMENFRAVKA